VPLITLVFIAFMTIYAEHDTIRAFILSVAVRYSAKTAERINELILVATPF